MAAVHRTPIISRRHFVLGAGVAGLGLLAGCGRLPGQAPATMPRAARVGVLAGQETATAAGYEHLREALQDLGYVVGQNLVLEARFPPQRQDLAPAAAELARLPVDVIVTGGISATLAAREATSTVPIVKSTGSVSVQAPC